MSRRELPTKTWDERFCFKARAWRFLPFVDLSSSPAHAVSAVDKVNSFGMMPAN